MSNTLTRIMARKLIAIKYTYNMVFFSSLCRLPSTTNTEPVTDLNATLIGRKWSLSQLKLRDGNNTRQTSAKHNIVYLLSAAVIDWGGNLRSWNLSDAFYRMSHISLYAYYYYIHQLYKSSSVFYSSFYSITLSHSYLLTRSFSFIFIFPYLPFIKWAYV